MPKDGTLSNDFLGRGYVFGLCSSDESYDLSRRYVLCAFRYSLMRLWMLLNGRCGHSFLRLASPVGLLPHPFRLSSSAAMGAVMLLGCAGFPSES